MQIRNCEYNMEEGGIPRANILSLCSANSGSYMSPVESEFADPSTTRCPPGELTPYRHRDQPCCLVLNCTVRLKPCGLTGWECNSQQLGHAARLRRGVKLPCSHFRRGFGSRTGNRACFRPCCSPCRNPPLPSGSFPEGVCGIGAEKDGAELALGGGGVVNGVKARRRRTRDEIWAV